MNATKTGRIVFTGTWDWWQIVSRDEIDLDDSGTYDSDHETAGELAELNQDDEESWVARVTAVDERHSAIRVGDYAVAPNGIGGDVVFVRLDDGGEESAVAIIRRHDPAASEEEIRNFLRKEVE